MKSLVTLICICALSVNSYAKHYIYPFDVLMDEADLIVVGEIENVNSVSYNFKISETVKGKEHKIIKVEMFKEWTCDIRMRKPVKGQKLLLFLRENGGVYQIINGSNGEKFIEEDKVLITFNNGNPTVDELTSLVKAFTSSFKIKDWSTQGKEKTFIQLKTDEEIKELTMNSELIKRFFEGIKSGTIEKLE